MDAKRLFDFLEKMTDLLDQMERMSQTDEYKEIMLSSDWRAFVQKLQPSERDRALEMIDDFDARLSRLERVV